MCWNLSHDQKSITLTLILIGQRSVFRWMTGDRASHLHWLHLEHIWRRRRASENHSLQELLLCKLKLFAYRKPSDSTFERLLFEHISRLSSPLSLAGTDVSHQAGSESTRKQPCAACRWCGFSPRLRRSNSHPSTCHSSRWAVTKQHWLHANRGFELIQYVWSRVISRLLNNVWHFVQLQTAAEAHMSQYWCKFEPLYDRWVEFIL